MAAPDNPDSRPRPSLMRRVPEWLYLVTGLGLILMFAVGALMPGSDRDAVKSWLLLDPVAVGPYAHFLFNLLAVVALCGYRLRLWWFHAGLVMICSGLVELGQYWVPGRNPAWRDFGLDAGGVLVGLVLVGMIRGYYRIGGSK